MNRSTQPPRPPQANPAPQDKAHQLMSLVAHAGKWLAQPGPRNQPG
ncbi:hypothetical protein [Allosphingosinicella deserti]|nr:hypothetical protein [Sphingomonas deserti]